MEIKLSKIEYMHGYWETRQLQDGSAMLIRYKEYEHKQSLEMIQTKTYGYLASERYYIDVKLPKQRDIEKTMIIIRSSQNNYKAMYASAEGAEFRVCNGLAELNLFVRSCENPPALLKAARA